MATKMKRLTNAFVAAFYGKTTTNTAATSQQPDSNNPTTKPTGNTRSTNTDKQNGISNTTLPLPPSLTNPYAETESGLKGIKRAAEQPSDAEKTRKKRKTIDPTYVPRKDDVDDEEGEEEEEEDEDEDEDESTSGKAKKQTTKKKKQIDPAYVPGKDDDDDEEEEGDQGSSAAGKDKKTPVRKKKQADPAYVPGKDDDDDDDDEEHAQGSKGKKTTRKSSTGTKTPTKTNDEDNADGDNKLPSTRSNKSKAKKKDVGPTYVPGKDDVDEHEDDYQDSSAAGKDKETPRKSLAATKTPAKTDDGGNVDTTSSKSKAKKKDADPTYVPGGDDSDDDLDGTLSTGDGKGSTPASTRSLRKRKRVSDTGSGNDKKSTVAPTAKRQKNNTPYPKRSLSPNLPNVTSQAPAPPTIVVSSPAGSDTKYNSGNPSTMTAGSVGGKNPRKRANSEPATETDGNLDYDTDKSDPTWKLPPKKKARHSTGNDGTLLHPASGATGNKPTKDGDDDDDADQFGQFPVSKSDKKGVTFDFSLERAKRWAAAVSLPAGLWNEAEKSLFFRLTMRGFEPLLSRYWQFDFSTLPESLFTVSGDDKAIIQAYKSSEFYAMKALSRLFSLGGHVRDCRILEIRPELVIKRSIQDYLRWAVHDAHVLTGPKTIPVYKIYTKKKGETTLRAVRKLNHRLEKLSKQYRDAALSKPLATKKSSTSSNRSQYPLLVGFVICGPIVAILTFDTDPRSRKGWSKGTGSKFISQFDISEWGQDVWNSLALAITSMHIRRTIVQLADAGEGGYTKYRDGMSSKSDEDL